MLKGSAVPGNELVQSLVRALDIMESVSRSPSGVRLADVSEELGLNTTTAYNLMRTLAERGYLQKDSLSRYRLGRGVTELLIQERSNKLMQSSGTMLLKLSSAMPGCVAGVTNLCDCHLRTLLRVSPERRNVLQYPVSVTLPLYSSCTGLAFLMQSIYAPGLFSYWPFEENGASFWKSKENLDAFLEKSRAQNFVTMELCGTRDSGIAMPLAENHVISLRCPKEDLKRGIRLLQTAVQKIREKTGEN
jgi:DNA-binding IclR family transcriptional regulator